MLCSKPNNTFKNCFHITYGILLYDSQEENTEINNIPYESRNISIKPAISNEPQHYNKSKCTNL